MKKLTIAAALFSLSIAAPAFACPEHDASPRTAEKAKDTAKPSETAKKDTKTAPKAEKPADQKTAEKVSQK